MVSKVSSVISIDDKMFVHLKLLENDTTSVLSSVTSVDFHVINHVNRNYIVVFFFAKVVNQLFFMTNIDCIHLITIMIARIMIGTFKVIKAVNRQVFVTNENVRTLTFFITLFDLRENTITKIWISFGNQSFENTEEFS